MKTRSRKNSFASRKSEKNDEILTRKMYASFETKKIERLHMDVKHILFSFIEKGVLKEVRELSGRENHVAFLAILYTGEEITFDCSFLNRVNKERFACVESSRNLVVMINPKTVNGFFLKEKIQGEVMKRFVGYQAEYIALQVLEKAIHRGATKISAVRKGSFYEDLMRRSDILVQWEGGNDWIGINIKTNKNFYEKSLKYFRGKVSDHGNPILTSLQELKNNPEKFIKNTEQIIAQYFTKKQKRLD